MRVRAGANPLRLQVLIEGMYLVGGRVNGQVLRITRAVLGCVWSPVNSVVG